jgi:hypothetical protein
MRIYRYIEQQEILVNNILFRCLRVVGTFPYDGYHGVIFTPVLFRVAEDNNLQLVEVKKLLINTGYFVADTDGLRRIK